MVSVLGWLPFKKYNTIVTLLVTQIKFEWVYSNFWIKKKKKLRYIQITVRKKNCDLDNIRLYNIIQQQFQ